VLLVIPVILDHKDQQGTSDHKDLKAIASLAELVTQVFRDLKVRLETLVLKVKTVLQETLVLQDRMAKQVLKDHKVTSGAQEI
jgi:hypothetical protein